MKLHMVALPLLAASALAAQDPTPVPVPLKPADATLKATLSSGLVTLHELRDGKVLISGAGAHLIVASFTSDRIDSVMEVPSGRLTVLAADSSLLRANGGWIFLDGAKVLGMLPGTNPVVATAPYLAGADSRGSVLMYTQSDANGDSAEVLLVNRTTGAKARVTRLQEWGIVMGNTPAPLYQNREKPVIFLDGWIAVLRMAPYRVDWRSPTGEWTKGAPVPVPHLTYDDREKQAYMVARAGLSRQVESPDIIKSWPATIEPTSTMSTMLATSDGKVLVLRTPTADALANRWDVINRTGERERQIVTAKNELIVGFGLKSVYVQVIDGRTSRLERRGWP